MNNPTDIPIFGFVAHRSDTGKTTLLVKLLPLLKAHGLRVGMIKHAHHGFDVDIPGKDSYRFRHAGADQVLVASRQRWALMVETEDTRPEPTLAELTTRLDRTHLDLVLAEGFKHEPITKIEVHRPSLGSPLLFPDDATIVAIATDAPLPSRATIPQLDLNRPETVADFLLKRLRSQ